ncbi:MAG: FHA domain-containing protein [Myxococcales bacterium]|nr:FHA domain-containing protein [Myxococcales bacterium]
MNSEIYISNNDNHHIYQRQWALEVVDGPRTGQYLPIHHTPVVLGSAAHSDFQFSSHDVAPAHAELHVGPDAMRIRDLGGRAGCHLNRQRVYDARVFPTDRIDLGETTLRVHVADHRAIEPQLDEEDLGCLVARSPSTQRVAAWVQHLAPQSVGICFVGPPSSGRTAWARHLHNLRMGKDLPFVVYHPLRTSRPLMGKGSIFEQAEGGTLVIDTPTSLQPDTQIALLDEMDSPQAPQILTIDALGISGQLVAGLAERVGTVHLHLNALHKRKEDLNAFLAYHLRAWHLPAPGAALSHWISSPHPTTTFRDIMSAFWSNWRLVTPEPAARASLRSAALTDLLAYQRGDVDAAAASLRCSSSALFKELSQRNIPLPE